MVDEVLTTGERLPAAAGRLIQMLVSLLNNVLNGKANTYGRVINEFNQRVVSVRSYCPNKGWIDVNGCPRRMILLETTQSRHVFCSLSVILAIGGDDSMASRAAHLGLSNISGSLANWRRSAAPRHG